MQILFTNTYYQTRVEYTSLMSVIPPLDLAYCAALVRRCDLSFSVSLIDANALRLAFDAHIKKISSFNPDIIIFTAATHSINAVKAIVEALRKDELVTVLIGTHGSARPQETLDEIPGLDIIVCGEPEYTVLDIVRSLKNNEPLDTIKGIAYREDGKVVMSEGRTSLVNVDLLPYPARDLLPNNKYFSPYSPRVTALQTTRGCPGRCKFCDSHLLYGNTIRTREPANIVDEIHECINHYGTRYFAIIDHTFTAKKKFVMEVCNKIIQRRLHTKIRWVCNTRVDLLNDAMLALMKRAGCIQIGIGIEQAIDKRLAAVNKMITEKQIEEAIIGIKRHGIIAMGYAIIGFPQDSRRDIEETKRKIFQLNPHTLQLSFATPLPGTELYEYCKGENRILSNNWDDYVFLRKSIIKNDSLSTEELESLRRNILRSFYFRLNKMVSLLFFFLFKARVNYVNCCHAFMKIVCKLK